MATQGNAAPVIIKRKKIVSGDGHHGGAWKVAYADFVTAMMAFFMLMWLLNATTEQQRKGLADFFSPTVPISRISGGGTDIFSGDSVFSEATMAQNGTGGMQLQPGAMPSAPSQVSGDQESEQDRLLQAAEDMLLGGGGESLIAENALKHVLTRLTDEGLVIEIFDLQELPLFDADSDTAMPILKELLTMIAEVAQYVENTVAIEGHTRAKPLVLAHDPNWELSAARANRARILLEKSGLASKRVNRVTGRSARETVVDDPMAVRNNRIEIILLRSDV